MPVGNTISEDYRMNRQMLGFSQVLKAEGVEGVSLAQKANPYGINQYTKGKGVSRQEAKAQRKVLSDGDKKSISTGLSSAFSTMAGDAQVKDNGDGTFTVTSYGYASTGGAKKNYAQQKLNDQQAENAEAPTKGAWDDTAENRALHAMHSKFTLKVTAATEKPDPDNDSGSIYTYTVEALQKKPKNVKKDEELVQKANPYGINQYTKGKGGGAGSMPDPSSFEGRTGGQRAMAFAASKQGQALNNGIGKIGKDLGVDVTFTNDGKGNKTGVSGTIRSGEKGKAAEAGKAADAFLRGSGFTKDKETEQGVFYSHPQGYTANYRETSRGDVGVSIDLPTTPKKARKEEEYNPSKVKKFDPLGSMFQ